MNEDTTELVRCSECGEFHPRSFCHELAGGRWVCDPCALSHGGVDRCDDCGKEFLADEMNDVHDDGKVCDECVANYAKCDECGEYVRLPDLEDVGGGHLVCPDCLDSEYIRCDGCGRWVRTDEANEVDGESFCDDCYDDTDYVIECEDCGERHLRDEMYDVGGDNDYRWVCGSCRSDYRRCPGCNEWFHYEDDRWACGSNGYCVDCCGDDDDGDGCGCIHDYHWGHSGWIDGPFYEKGEKKGATLTYGVELEMAEGTFDADAMSDGDNMYHFEHDGSLDGGDACELITQPCSLAYHRTSFGWDSILSACVKCGYVSHNAECSCGMHVHIGRDCLTQCDELKLDVWFNRYEKYWKHIARRNSGWGRMVPDRPMSSSAIVAKYKNDNNHHAAVNHGNRNTVEIRVAKGSLRLDTVLGTLEAYDAVIHYLRNVGCYDLYNNIDKVWQGYLRYLAGRPREYEHAIRMIERLHSYKVTKDAVAAIDAKLAKKGEWESKNKKEGK